MNSLQRRLSASASLHISLILGCLLCIPPVVSGTADDSLKGTFSTVNKPISKFVQLNDLASHINIARKIVPSKTEDLPLTDCSDSRKRCTWERTYGGPLPDKAYDIAALSDGGVVAVGHTRSTKGIGHDVLVLRIDRKGHVVWRRMFGGLKEDHAYGVVTGDNEDIVVSGYTSSKGKGKGDLWVCRINTDGLLIWEHTYGGVLDDRARTITAINDGGYVVAGYTQSKGDSEGDSWVIKINESGRLVWEQTFSRDGEDGIFQIKALPDGSLFATGYSDLGGSAGFDLRVLKISKNGGLIWERIFGKSVFDSGTAIEPASDGGCIVAGVTAKGGYQDDQAWILRLNPKGDLVWQRTIGGKKTDSAWAVITKDSSHYAVVIATSSFGSGSTDAWIICFDRNGNQKWERIYGGKLWDRPTSATLTEDGGLYIGGYTTTRGKGYEDFWLLRLDSNGNL
jgi:uncharacterized delta-60 repeat protein